MLNPYKWLNLILTTTPWNKHHVTGLILWMRNLSLKRSGNLLKMNWVSSEGLSESNIYQVFSLLLCFSLNFLFIRLIIGLSVLLLFSNSKLLVLLIEYFFPVLIFSAFIFIDLFLQLFLNLCCYFSSFLDQCLKNFFSKNMCLRLWVLFRVLFWLQPTRKMQKMFAFLPFLKCILSILMSFLAQKILRSKFK